MSERNGSQASDDVERILKGGRSRSRSGRGGIFQDSQDGVSKNHPKKHSEKQREKQQKNGEKANSGISYDFQDDFQEKKIEDEPEPWDDLIPLDSPIQAPSFPVEVFPASVREFVLDTADAINCPPDYIAIPSLVVAGGTIGATRALRIKQGYSERPALYAAVIAPPGSGKSPGLKMAASPLYAEQVRLMQHYKKAREAYQNEIEKTKPKPTTLYVNDATTEKLAELLEENPRGITIIRDELSAWVMGMDLYRAKGRGNDKQFYLAGWAGEPLAVHRKSQESGPVYVAHPFIAVVGCLPPDLLSKLRGENGVCDGFSDRILFSFPEPFQAIGETWAQVRDEVAQDWADVVLRLRGLSHETDDDGSKRPRYVRFTTEGRNMWEEFTSNLAAELNDASFPDCLRGPYSKLRSYGARLALILQLLWQACQETQGEDVDGDSMARAVLLVQYFKAHVRKVLGSVDGDKELEKSQRILEWIKREGKSIFKRYEPFNDIKNINTFPNIDSLDEPLNRLVKHNYIRPLVAGRQTRGRPPTATFEVHPSILENHHKNLKK